jgi:tetratricopeptide (TPR) repeat protein
MGLFSKKTAEDYIKKAMLKFNDAPRNRSGYNDIVDLLYDAQLLEPNNAEIYFLKGWVSNHFNEFTNAIFDTNKAIKLNPNYADAYYTRAYAKTQMKKYTEALEDLDKAISLKPDFKAAIIDRESLITLLDKNLL